MTTTFLGLVDGGRGVLAHRPDFADLLFADGFDGAIVGVLEQLKGPALVCYDTAQCLAILEERDGMDEDEAMEFFQFNITGAYVGARTPLFLNLPWGQVTRPRE